MVSPNNQLSAQVNTPTLPCTRLLFYRGSGLRVFFSSFQVQVSEGLHGLQLGFCFRIAVGSYTLPDTTAKTLDLLSHFQFRAEPVRLSIPLYREQLNFNSWSSQVWSALLLACHDDVI